MHSHLAILLFIFVQMRKYNSSKWRSGPMRFAPSARTQAADSLPPTANSGTVRLLFPPHQKICTYLCPAATADNTCFESSDITESKIQSQPLLCRFFMLSFRSCMLHSSNIYYLIGHIFVTFWDIHSRFIFSQHLRVSCFSDEHKMLRDMCRTFADTELAPNAGKWLDTNIYLHACVCVSHAEYHGQFLNQLSESCS